MSENKTFRLLFSHKKDANFNMSMDKALVQSYEEKDLPILRLYTWKDSFSVGLSQKCEAYPEFLKEYKNNCSKRITGGGLLFHGHDLSYSLILAHDEFKTLSVKQSYEKICQFLITFYKDLGLNSCFAKDSKNIILSKSEFCQIGFEAYDILVNGIKIGGNAQKRSKKLVFQHGSIPIKSIKKDKKIGVSLEDFGINLSFEKAKERLIKSFEKTFNTKVQTSSLKQKEEKNLINLLGNKQ